MESEQSLIFTNSQLPLHLAAKEGDLERIKSLVIAGYKINQTDIFGSTPLHLAAMYGHDKVLDYLISAGANTNAKTYREYFLNLFEISSYTPVDLALRYSPNTQTVALLLKKGGQSSEIGKMLSTLFKDVVSDVAHSNYASFDLTLSKIDTVASEKKDVLLYYDGVQDLPLNFALGSLLDRVIDEHFYARIMNSLQTMSTPDSITAVQYFVAAKNLLHSFPSNEKYHFQIENHLAIIKAEGGSRIFSTALAAHSMEAYQKTIADKLDMDCFKALNAKFADNPLPMLKNIEAFSDFKQQVFENLVDTLNFSAQHVPKLSLPQTSQIFFEQYSKGKTILLPSCGWEGHSIDVILDKNTHLVMIANAGEQFKGLKPGLNAYHNQFDIQAEDIYSILTTKDKMDFEFKKFYDLGLEAIADFSIQTPGQKFGNCTWYSHEVANRGLLLLELQKAHLSPELSKELSQLWFQEWKEFHQTLVLDEYLAAQSLEINALADILVHYHDQLKMPQEQARAQLLVDTLLDPSNKSDFDHYYATHKNDFSPQLKDFMEQDGYTISDKGTFDFIYDVLHDLWKNISPTTTLTTQDVLDQDQGSISIPSLIEPKQHLMVTVEPMHTALSTTESLYI
jgi:hypothetical protein